MARTIATAKCVWCRKNWRPRRPEQKFHNRSCARAIKNAFVTLKCSWVRCDATFERRRKDVSRHNFCGDKHRGQWLAYMGRKWGGPAPAAYQGPNLLEQQMSVILREEGIPVRFVGDDPNVLVAGVSVDFMNDVVGIVVEVFGQNWHTEGDAAERLRVLRRAGWRAIVVWERELRGRNWNRVHKRCSGELRKRLRSWWRRVKKTTPRFERPTVNRMPDETEGDLAHEEYVHVPIPDIPELEAVPF